MRQGFLHRHPFQERSLEQGDHYHVVVDRVDWENALKLIDAAGKQRDYLFNGGKNAELILQGFSDAIKRCNQNTHR